MAIKQKAPLKGHKIKWINEKGLPYFRASHRYARISPRKARLVIDMIRGKSVNEAQLMLEFCPKRGAYFVKKVLKSAMANAEELIVQKKLDADIERFYIAEARVDEGPTLKRWLPRARGHATPIHKRTSHIHLVLDELEEESAENQRAPKSKRKTDQKTSPQGKKDKSSA
ncbi:MAG: 50S ribosomal protein L22, partial [Planctomycetota bacterium]